MRARSAAGSTLAAVEANFSNSAVSNNVTGILNSGGTTTIRLNNNDISFNGTAITGATQSFRNNRIAGNGAAGTAPTVIGATSDPSGMQQRRNSILGCSAAG